MVDFDELAAQTSACAVRWEDARARYAGATADWAKALRAFADHLEGGEQGEHAETLRGFADSLDASVTESPLPELVVRDLVGPPVGWA